MQELLREASQQGATLALMNLVNGIVQADRVIPGMSSGGEMARIKQRVNLPDGRKVWCTGNTWQDAVENLVKVCYDSRPQGEVPYLKEYAEKWLELYHLPKVTYGTGRNTRSYLKNHIYPVVGSKRLNEITHDDIQRIFNNMSRHGESTVHNVQIILNQIMKNAVEDQLISRNVMDSSRYVKSKKVTPRQALDIEAVKDILANIDKLEERDRLFVALALYTGMRRGEIYALRWDHVDLDSRMIHVDAAIKLEGNKAVIGEPKSKAGIRMIPICDKMLEILNRCKDHNGYVIKSKNAPDAPLTSSGMNRQWQRIKRKIDVHGATPHVFRHTFATMIQPHTDIKTLQTVMGHADIETTMDRYTHTVNKNIVALAQINPYL